MPNLHGVWPAGTAVEGLIRAEVEMEARGCREAEGSLSASKFDANGGSGESLEDGGEVWKRGCRETCSWDTSVVQTVGDGCPLLKSSGSAGGPAANQPGRVAVRPGVGSFRSGAIQHGGDPSFPSILPASIPAAIKNLAVCDYSPQSDHLRAGSPDSRASSSGAE